MVARLQQEYDVEVTWLPFLLRPNMPREGMPLPSYVQEQAAAMQARLRQMVQENGMDMVFPDWIPNSHRALEAAEYAREQGRHDAFHTIVFRKFYGEGQDISRWAVLRSAAEEAGLNPGAMQRETESGRYHAVVQHHFELAQRLGVYSIPTYILNDQYAIVGAQPYAAFQQALARIGASHS